MIQQLLALAACLVIIAVTEPAINRMSCRSPLVLRIGFWLICVAAAGAVLDILLGNVPPWSAVIGAVGIAALLIGERRVLTRYTRRREIDKSGGVHAQH